MNPSDITASEIIALERSMISKAIYINSRHGTGNPPEFDCIGFQDWALWYKGVAVELRGNTVPWKVWNMYNQWRGQKLNSSATTLPGDILVIGNPKSLTQDYIYAHMGMVTTPGMYISALNPKAGIVEMAIPTFSDFQVIWILRPGWREAMAIVFDSTHAIGTLEMTADHSGKRLDGSLLDHIPTHILYPVFAIYHDTNDPANVMRYLIQVGMALTPVGMQVGADTTFTSVVNATTLDIVGIKADLNDALLKLG